MSGGGYTRAIAGRIGTQPLARMSAQALGEVRLVELSACSLFAAFPRDY